MIRNTLRKLADVSKDNSFASKMRQKRIALFKQRISPLPRPLRILDVGGTEVFWETMGFAGEENIRITLLNLSKTVTHYPNFESVVGDAREMNGIRDDEFDVVFSNSVIEHVGSYEDQKQMALEIQRVGKKYFLQTPNFYFPFEPHFLFPLFQFLPFWFEVFLIRHLDLGDCSKVPNKRQAVRLASSVRLLKKQELMGLFPGATIISEKFLGLTMSFIILRV